MKNLLQLIQTFDSTSWTDAVIMPGHLPRVKENGEWSSRGPAFHNDLQMKTFIESALPQASLDQLKKSGCVRGAFPIQGGRVQYYLYPSSHGQCLQLVRQQNVRWEELFLPENLIKAFAKPQGLFLILGGKDSDKEVLFSQLVAQSPFFKGVTLVVGQGMLDLGPMSLAVDEETFAQGHWPTEAVDAIVVEPNVLTCPERIFHELQRGIPVFLMQDSVSLIDFFMDSSRKESAESWDRMVRHFSWGLQLQKHWTMKNESVHACEIAFGSEKLKSSLFEKNWPRLIETMKSGGDLGGMRTMNQSVVNLIMKRRVDLKTGFEMSAHPEELDSMLRQIGI